MSQTLGKLLQGVSLAALLVGGAGSVAVIGRTAYTTIQYQLDSRRSMSPSEKATLYYEYNQKFTELGKEGPYFLAIGLAGLGGWYAGTNLRARNRTTLVSSTA